MKRNVLLGHRKTVLLKHKKYVGGNVPLLLKHIPRGPVFVKSLMIGNGLPNTNTQIGITSGPVAPNHSGVLGLTGGKILNIDSSTILKNMNFTKQARGKKSKVIKIEF